MRIIDAHIHFRPGEAYFDQLAISVGHQNSAVHLKKAFAEQNICHAIVMGNRGLSIAEHDYPDFLSYCVGLDYSWVSSNGLETSVDLVEQHLRRKNCVGIKLYPGYNCGYVTDPQYAPFYALAQTYGKPVAIHTGATASSGALLKFSHPLTLDELAVQYPKVQFVMCHFGNPFLTEAAAVLEKNKNVAADLSGLLDGRVDVPAFWEENRGYTGLLSAWLSYTHAWDRLIYGTDWPLVDFGEYIAFIQRLIPERYWHAIFFENANRIYRLGLDS